MINEIYIALDIALASASFVLGLLFYSLCSNTESPAFRTALRMMVFAYCFCGLVILLEMWVLYLMPDTDNVLLFQITTLIVAVSQAFLFTHSLILLIHSAYVTHKRVLREITLLITLSVTLVLACFILSADWIKIAVYLFALFYFCMIIRYVRLFTITYRNCLQKMDNFFSGQEAEHLKWVKLSFYTILSIGLLVLVTSWFSFTYFMVVYSAICFVFLRLFCDTVYQTQLFLQKNRRSSIGKQSRTIGGRQNRTVSFFCEKH